MLDSIPTDALQAEPLTRLDDLAQFRRGLEMYTQGQWDDERFTAFRLRFGVYGQKQPGVQMVRIKIPGGRLPVAWLPVLAEANRRFAHGPSHLTTRQDIQIYSVDLARSPELLDLLYTNGITTREACGNTIRNLSACAGSGACGAELIDAGAVADQLARAWIRHPLVQNMPRKLKFTVSGCAQDCGHSAIHDLGFVAILRDGQPGFRVVAGGGLGGQPRAAVEVLDFVSGDDLPLVVETLARLHQRYSDRRNRNAARVKFVVKRFGDDKFRALFVEEFERLRGLPQRPWAPLDWHPAPLPGEHIALTVSVPLGNVESHQWDGLAAIAEQLGVRELRATRDQNLVMPGVPKDAVADALERLRAIGLAEPERAVPVISCPGTTTCRIGITNSQNFARHLVETAAGDPAAANVRVHVSGCQNSCGLHHVADIGLHGAAKKVDGRSAPHYQLHFGGDATIGAIALSGPTIPARHAGQAVNLLRRALADDRLDGETVRAWAERQGKDGIDAILAPLAGASSDKLFIDWGDAHDFPGAPQAKGECAAPFAMDLCHADLADDALIAMDRALLAGRGSLAAQYGDDAVAQAARRALHARAIPFDAGGGVDPLDLVLAQAASGWGDQPRVAAALAGVAPARRVGGNAYRDAVAELVDAVRAAIEAPAPVVAAIGDLAALLGGGE